MQNNSVSLVEIITLILALASTLTLIIGPILAYITNSRKSTGDLLMADVEARKKWQEIEQGWDVSRRKYEQELSEVHALVDLEREKRREMQVLWEEERAKRIEQTAELQEIKAELAYLKKQLEECDGD